MAFINCDYKTKSVQLINLGEKSALEPDKVKKLARTRNKTVIIQECCIYKLEL